MVSGEALENVLRLTEYTTRKSTRKVSGAGSWRYTRAQARLLKDLASLPEVLRVAITPYLARAERIGLCISCVREAVTRDAHRSPSMN